MPRFHFPLNHPWAGFYRGLAVVTAILMVVVSVTLSDSAVFAVIMWALAIPVLAGTFLSRVRHHYVNESVGAALILLGIVGLLLLNGDNNFLELRMSTCIILFILGTVLLATGMYTKPGSHQQARAEDAYRHTPFGRVAEPAKALSAPHTRAEELAEQRSSDEGSDERRSGEREERQETAR